MKRILLCVLALLACASFLPAQDKLYADEFPLGDVTLLDGPLKHARDLNIQTLLQYDCDRLLARTARRRVWSPRRRPTPTGTAWTATWPGIT